MVWYRVYQGSQLGLVVSGVWLHIISPTQNALLIVLCGFVTQASGIWWVRHAINWRALLPFIIGGAFGVPAGTRDVELLDFLSRHHATRFYTTYWVCYRLMFDAQERADCYVVSNSDPFTPGVNKELAYVKTATAAKHPAYVFDLTTTEVQPGVPIEISAQIAAHASRFAGYIGVQIAGYAVFYYTGAG